MTASYHDHGVYQPHTGPAVGFPLFLFACMTLRDRCATSILGEETEAQKSTDLPKV